MVKDVSWIKLSEGNGQWRMKKLTFYTISKGIYFNRRETVDPIAQNCFDI
jgi:hypothetical protein